MSDRESTIPLWMQERGITPEFPSQVVVRPLSEAKQSYREQLGDGPGTILLEMNKADYGVPPCKDCTATAHKMNAWGPHECLRRIEELVNEIQPRVEAWLKLGELGGQKVSEPTWAMRLAAESPEAAQRYVIRRRIRKACRAAKKKEARESRAAAGRGRVRRGGKIAVVYSDLPIEPVDLQQSTRHLMMHLWPTRNGSWQWNVDHLRRQIDLFNGRRIIAVATDKRTDTFEQVREQLADVTDDVLPFANRKTQREVLTFVPMLEKLEAYQGPGDVTFSCHGKGAKHAEPDVDNPTSTVYRWTAAMYECLLDWERVRPQLETKAMAGAFLRERAHGGDWGPWHFSGTFYWFRNRDVFARDWRTLPSHFYGTEAWPGLIFRREEVATLLGVVKDLYNVEHYRTVAQPLLEQWRADA